MPIPQELLTFNPKQLSQWVGTHIADLKPHRQGIILDLFLKKDYFGQDLAAFVLLYKIPDIKDECIFRLNDTTDLITLFINPNLDVERDIAKEFRKLNANEQDFFEQEFGFWQPNFAKDIDNIQQDMIEYVKDIEYLIADLNEKCV